MSIILCASIVSESSLDPTWHAITSQSLCKVSPVGYLKQGKKIKAEAGVTCPLCRVLLHFPEPSSWKPGKTWKLLSLEYPIPPNSFYSPYSVWNTRISVERWTDVKWDKGLYAHLFISSIFVTKSFLSWLFFFFRVYVLLKGHKVVGWYIVSSFKKSKHCQEWTC